MRPDVRAEVLMQLKLDYQFRDSQGDWLRGGKCPVCGGKELYVSAAAPWVVKCGRENKCGWSASTRDLYPDAFGKFNERFPATTEDPTATADAYMGFVRGLDVGKIRGWYRQGRFAHPKGDRVTATVVFDLAEGVWMERLVEPVRVTGADGEVEIRKANFVGAHKGMAWMPPGQTAPEGELWLVEGCIDAITLALHGLPAAATLSAGNFPDKFLAGLDQHKVTLVWALDNDKAGNGATAKHVKAARALGFVCRAAVIPQPGRAKVDWNDAHLAHALEPEDIERYRHHGDLMLAATAVEKGALVWQRTKATAFAVEHGCRTFWWSLEQTAYALQLQEIAGDITAHERGDEFEAALRAAKAVEIANCLVRFLYFQENPLTDESWYYARVEFPHGKHLIKNTFTGGQIAAASEFKKRLLSIAPGALFSGGTGQLNWIIGRHLDAIKRVETVDFIGYSKAHRAWIFPDKAVSGGRVFDLNDEDFFEIDRLSIKSLNGSMPIQIGRAADYDRDWIGKVYRAFGAKGIIAAAFFLGSLFAEQIRDRHKSYPFLEIVGEAGAGKSTLIEFLWKLVGRADYEGFDPNKATIAARARIMSQVANLPVCMIESDRGGEDTVKVRQFDWDELKTAYNGRASRATGVKNGGTDTKEPPFRGAIVISQNAQVNASEAIMQRIVHLMFTCAGHTDESKLAADQLAAAPVERLSHFLIEATSAEDKILALFFARAAEYETQLKRLPEVRHVRIAKNHGQIMALVDALATLVEIPRPWREEVMQALAAAAIERQRSIASDHPIVDEFWDVYDFIGPDQLNHSRDPARIAINMPHLQKLAAQHGQGLPAPLDLKRHLKTSQSRPFVAIKAVNSGLGPFEGKTMKCWVFGAGRGGSTDAA